MTSTDDEKLSAFLSCQKFQCIRYCAKICYDILRMRRKSRFCPICKSDNVDNEIHFLTECPEMYSLTELVKLPLRYTNKCQIDPT